MNNNYGFDLEDYRDNPSNCINLLSSYLNQGNLGLLLGAGVSYALSLPNWLSLVTSICKEYIPTAIDPSKDYNGHELKDLTEQAKRFINNQEEYMNAVKKHLYKDVTFDFALAKKDLLIALSSLVVGKRRGTVQDIFTYNFDSVLEWYLTMLGLNVNTITSENILAKHSDVHISHVHGYLPHNPMNGENSNFLIFSHEEFQDRAFSSEDFWKASFLDFFRRHTFLAVGMSIDSIYNDVCPYLRELNRWYERQQLNRAYPYGVAILTPDAAGNSKLANVLEQGIIPVILPHNEIPNFIFNIVKSASTANMS